MFIATQPELPVRDMQLATAYLKYLGFKLIRGAWLKGQHHGAEIRITPNGTAKIKIGKHV